MDVAEPFDQILNTVRPPRQIPVKSDYSPSYGVQTRVYDDGVLIHCNHQHTTQDIVEEFFTTGIEEDWIEFTVDRCLKCDSYFDGEEWVDEPQPFN